MVTVQRQLRLDDFGELDALIGVQLMIMYLMDRSLKHF